MLNFKTLTNNVLSLFYPKLCLGCHNVLQQNEEHLCIECLLHLPETNYHLHAQNPLAFLFAGRVHVTGVTSFLFFRKGTHVQNILHSLKYRGNKEIGAYLGEYYGERLLNAPLFKDADIILPIPLHTKKLQKRGYNQSEWIAKGLSKSMNIPYANDILIRTSYTETQTKKSRYNRWENVKEVFSIRHEDQIKGKHILVCDDVLTTGATMEAAIQKILEIEGTRVSVVTLACAN